MRNLLQLAIHQRYQLFKRLPIAFAPRLEQLSYFVSLGHFILNGKPAADYTSRTISAALICCVNDVIREAVISCCAKSSDNLAASCCANTIAIGSGHV